MAKILRKCLAISAMVALMGGSAFFTTYQPLTAAIVNCPPGVETCHDVPRSVPGHGCQGNECFSTSEICCI